MERNLTSAQQPGAPSGVDRKTIGSDDATVMEQLGGSAAPTMMESKASWGTSQAESTVLERKGTIASLQPAAPKKNLGLFAAIAGVLVLAIGGGVTSLLRSRYTPPEVTTSSTSRRTVSRLRRASSGPTPGIPPHSQASA